MKKEDRKYQQGPILRIMNIAGKLVLGMCPNSGKTIVTILGIDAYLKKHPNEKWLVIAHSTNVIKANFIESLEQVKNHISFTWSTDLSDNSQVHIIISANSPNVSQKYNNVCVDEAHENYLGTKQSKDQIKNLIKKIGAKNELLLTGTPSKFIKEGYANIEFVSLLDMPSQYMSTLGIELIETRYNWRDQYMNTGSLKKAAFGNMRDSERAMESITLEILKKIRFGLTAAEFNRVRTLKRLRNSTKSIMGELFGKIMKRTMFVCGSADQADDVNLILNNNGVSSHVSHYKSDESSELFDDFKKGKFNVLVVVNRGRLGYSDNELYNIVDMSGTHNPDLIYQMFARVLRGKPNQQKFYYKVTTQEAGMRSLTHMSTCAALMLTDRKFLSTFNGKNFNGMKIPVVSSERKASTSTKKVVSKVSDKLRLPEFTNDIIDFMRNVVADSDKPTSVYKMTTIAEVKVMLGEVKKFQCHWGKENCIEEAKKYDKPYDLNRSNRTVYQYMIKNRWMHEVWPDFVYRNQSETATIENTIKILESGKFKKLKDLHKAHHAVYNNFVKDNEELKKKYFPNSKILKRWTDEECISLLKKCKSRYEAQKKYRTSYQKIKSKNPDLIDEIFGVEKGRRKTWTRDKILDLAKKCKSRNDMQLKYPGAYSEMNKNYKNVAVEVFGEKTNRKGMVRSNTWTEEKAMKAASECKTRVELYDKNSGAVRWLMKNNPEYLDKHLPKGVKRK